MIKKLILVSAIGIALTGCETSQLKIGNSVHEDNGSLIGMNANQSNDPTVVAIGLDEDGFMMLEDEMLSYSQQRKQYDESNKTETEHNGVEADKAFNPHTTLFYGFDKYSVSKEHEAKLKEHVDFLINNPESVIVLEGHTDEKGTAEYNIALGERRSRSARDYLLSMGVHPDQMDYMSYGEELPLSLESSPEGYTLNRRVEIRYK